LLLALLYCTSACTHSDCLVIVFFSTNAVTLESGSWLLH